MINVITRTCGRPAYFATCRKSVEAQIYKDVRHIIVVDDPKSEKYVAKYQDRNDVKMVKVKKLVRGKHGTFPFNLYFNEAYRSLEPGWIIFLDDDNQFKSKMSLAELVKHIETQPENTREDSVFFWRVWFPDRGHSIPKGNFGRVTSGNVDSAGFCFHSKHIPAAQWDANRGCDYRVAAALQECLQSVWIDKLLTSLQTGANDGRVIDKCQSITDMYYRRVMRSMVSFCPEKIKSVFHLPRIIKANVYNFSLSAISRCLLGTLKLYRAPIKKSKPGHREIETLTFSFTPWLTDEWSRRLQFLAQSKVSRILIGDCSGGMRPSSESKSNIMIQPYMNFVHGKKLDTFIRKVCSADYVWICDDDVFMVDTHPLDWALEEFRRSETLAVISFNPRQYQQNIMNREGIAWSMGSDSLIIRRTIWLKENLSCKTVYPRKPSANEVDYFDTCDYAHVTLKKRGYEVLIAPGNIQKCFISFEGISNWSRRIILCKGELRESVKSLEIRQIKALRAAEFVRLVHPLSNNEYSKAWEPFMKYFNRAKEICIDLLGEQKSKLILTDIYSKIEHVKKGMPFRGNADEKC